MHVSLMRVGFEGCGGESRSAAVNLVHPQLARLLREELQERGMAARVVLGPRHPTAPQNQPPTLP